ncbi:MAG: Gfo/Idh/MocA family protein [Kiritimatiellia bacterium]
MNLGIIGCGLIGVKRAAGAGSNRVVAVTDVIPERAHKLAAQHSGCVAARDVGQLLQNPAVDAVVVATTHDQLVPMTMAALKAGKHVLVEKPGARNSSELKPVLELARARNLVVKVGFNHRFHPSLLKAREIFLSDVMGPLMFIRGRYGHGARIGYEKEWRADAAISGGGELVDQGSHLIDLSRWFLGDFTDVSAYLPTCFWDMKVEDNAFMLLKTAHGQAAWLHATWTEWKNMFSMEIYGRTGKIQIDGLGGSYGPERLTYYQMLPQMGPPETKVFEFEKEDKSWALEMEQFAAAISGCETISAGMEDAYAVLSVIGLAYTASRG